MNHWHNPGFWDYRIFGKKKIEKKEDGLLPLEISGDLQGCLVHLLNWNQKYFHRSPLWRIPELIDSGNSCILSQILNLCYAQKALSILRRGNSSLKLIKASSWVFCHYFLRSLVEEHHLKSLKTIVHRRSYPWDYLAFMFHWLLSFPSSPSTLWEDPVSSINSDRRMFY